MTETAETPPWRAVVDVGSVSTGLLLTDGDQRIRRSVDTHLGAGKVAAGGETVEAAIDATALDKLRSVLSDYRHLASSVGADGAASIRALGTSAARRASNRAELEAVVVETLGVPLDVLDPAGEATLAFAGACSGPRPARSGVDRAGAGPGKVVTIDIGGGSTDFAVGEPGADPAVWSMPLGGALVTDAYLAADPPSADELSAALSVVELHLDDVKREAPPIVEAIQDQGTLLLGLGGIVTIAAVEVGLLDVDPLNGDGDGPLHGLRLERDAVEEVFRTLATEARIDRAYNPGLPPSRVDDIVGGCILLVETMRQFGIEEITVSQRGLADGAQDR
jgi:exopolyphosphatase/guanosine-5'-triphosphate,3'-diphosphate pyrophosphatase